MAQVNEIDFAWDEWEGEFRGIVDKMTDEEWGNLDDNLTRMEEQEEEYLPKLKSIVMILLLVCLLYTSVNKLYIVNIRSINTSFL